jgi:hypothetical protein
MVGRRNIPLEVGMDLISKRDAARFLGVSPYSMNRLMREIGYVRIGKRRVMFLREALLEYVQSRTVPPQRTKREDV